MNSDKFRVVNEMGKEKEAEVITTFSYKDRDYIVYSIDKNEEDANIYVSRLSKDEEGYDTICDIDDENERSEVMTAVREILAAIQ